MCPKLTCTKPELRENDVLTAPQTSGFLALPLGLRKEIYLYTLLPPYGSGAPGSGVVLVQHKDMRIHEYQWISEYLDLDQPLSINRQISREVEEVPFGQCRFIVFGGPPPDLFHPKVRSLIRHCAVMRCSFQPRNTNYYNAETERERMEHLARGFTELAVCKIQFTLEIDVFPTSAGDLVSQEYEIYQIEESARCRTFQARSVDQPSKFGVRKERGRKDCTSM